MAFIRAHQLDIMLFMSGICAILAYMTLITDSLARERKSILALMGLSAMLLLLFDRYCYLYRGNTGAFSFLMVRLSNGLVFFLSIFIALYTMKADISISIIPPEVCLVRVERTEKNPTRKYCFPISLILSDA